MEGADALRGPCGAQLLQLARLTADPDVVYVSSRAEPEVAAALCVPQPGSAPGRTPEVRAERAALFQPVNARRALGALHVRGTPRGLGARERMHRLNAVLSLGAEAQVCAAGALLAILARDSVVGPPAAAAGVRRPASRRCQLSAAAAAAAAAALTSPPAASAGHVLL